MKFIKFVILLSVFISAVNVNAQYNYGFDFSKAGSGGLQFLKIGVGSRETALGQAVSSIVRDAAAIFYNPAGISFVENRELSLSYNKWLAQSSISSASCAMPIGQFVVGVGVISFRIDDFEETTALAPDGTGRMVSAGDLAIIAGAARRFTDRLSIGLNVKYVHEKLDDYSHDNALFDVGAIYATGFRDLTLGFALQHFGPDMKLVDQKFRTPLQFRISASDKQQITPKICLTGAVELIHPTDNVETVQYGLEAKLYDYLFLRAGYRQNVEFGKLSFGIGIVPPVSDLLGMKLDYSFTSSELIFNNVQRFSIAFSF